jgi:hypothetical protein
VNLHETGSDRFTKRAVTVSPNGHKAQLLCYEIPFGANDDNDFNIAESTFAKH